LSRKLVIVESPTKARALEHILGSGFEVKASLGHVRDLPETGMGVSIEDDFAPHYIVLPEKKKVVKELKEAARRAGDLYLATDPDREGETIAWHLTQVLDIPPDRALRVEFHEITPKAVKEAFHSPRSIDYRLVEAGQARRILDRLVGYKLSPLLWHKVRGGLSAGRVQSAALKMIVDREREIEAFVPREYWTVEAALCKPGRPESIFRAKLIAEREIPSEAEAQRLAGELVGAEFVVSRISSREVSRQPAPPFITSTLQQEASRKLGFSPERTMFLAQQLYEGVKIGDEVVGLITYMRTDAVRVSPEAVARVREYIREKFPAEYLPAKPRQFAQKVKGAQEAHEAIRPTDIFREPSQVAPYLTGEQLALYELIWRRMLASQMAAAKFHSVSVNIEARTGEGVHTLRAASSRPVFPGFRTIYEESREDEEEPEGRLPELKEGEALELVDVFTLQHFTQPPPRYTEASLIKALEERGIGRPSTYAPTLATLKERRYVEKKGGKLFPTPLGRTVTEILEAHFPGIVNLNFTAEMEEKLDKIARGEAERVPVLREFYTPFIRDVSRALKTLPRVRLEEEATEEVCPQCGRPMVIKEGRYGKFLSCSAFPQCRESRPYVMKLGVTCPDCGGELVQREGKRHRIFYGCLNFPRCRFTVSHRPLPFPCPHCGGLLTERGKGRARCLGCSRTVSLKEKTAV